MSTCDTCKHWALPEKYYVSVAAGNSVATEARTPIHGGCHCPALNLYYNNEHKGHEFNRLDGMLGRGGRMVQIAGPKFGCIHHEPKS